MALKQFGIKNRTALTDTVRRSGFDSFGTKAPYGGYYNEMMFKSVADYALGTQDQVKVQGLADVYYASTNDFRDINDAIVSFVANDRINIVIDQLERDIVFPATKLIFQAHSLVDMNGFDITVAGETEGRIELTNFGSNVLNISGQSNGLKTNIQKTNLDIKDTEVVDSQIHSLFWTGNYVLVGMTGGNNGIASYSIDSGGILSLEDTLDIGTVVTGDTEAITTDGTYFITSNDGDGLYSISINGSGVLTEEDNLTGIATNDVAYGQGYILIASAGSGLRSADIDGEGAMALVDLDDQGGTYTAVAVDSNFIYTSNASLGLLSYSMSGGGVLTHIDTENTVTDFVNDPDERPRCVAKNGFIYATSRTGLHSYSVSVGGVITHISTIPLSIPGSLFVDEFGNLFVTEDTTNDNLIHYRTISDGTLEFIQTLSFSSTTGSGPSSVYGSDNKFIYYGDNDSVTPRLRSYELENKNINFSGLGTMFNLGNKFLPQPS